MMKNIVSVLSLTAAICIGTACAKENPAATTGSEELYSYSFALDETTRTVLDGSHLAWESGDVLGAYVNNGSLISANQSSPVNTAVTPRQVTIHSTVAINAGSSVYAYFPYTASNGSTPNAVTLKIPTEQYQSSEGVFDSDAMPLVSVPWTAGSNLGTETGATLKMVGLGSLLCINVYSTDATIATEKIKKVIFTAGSSAKIAGNFTYDLTATSYNASTLKVSVGTLSGWNENSVSTGFLPSSYAAPIGSTEENGTKVYMVIAPVMAGGQLVIVTDNATCKYKVTVPPIEFARNATRTLHIDLASAQIQSTENGIWSADDLLAAATALNAGESAEKYLVNGKLTLMADLNMKNLAWTPVTTLNVDFDGNGHSIKNWTTSDPLFETVGADVTISDLTIAKGCTYNVKTGTQSGTGQLPAFITSTNHGTLSGCTNYGRIKMSSGLNYRYVGAFAALSNGHFSNCINRGTFILDSQASLQVGGIVGQVRGGSIRGCENHGDIVIGSCSYTMLGGIVGRIEGTSSTVSLSNLGNSGNFNAVSNVTTNENEIGGIVGSCASVTEISRICAS